MIKVDLLIAVEHNYEIKLHMHKLTTALKTVRNAPAVTTRELNDVNNEKSKLWC